MASPPRRDLRHRRRLARSASAASASGITSAAACSGTRAITEFDASPIPARSRRRCRRSPSTCAQPLDGDDEHDRTRGRSEALFARRAVRRDRRARGLERRRTARRRARRRRDHRQRRRRHRRRRGAVRGLLHQRRPPRHALRHRRRHLSGWCRARCRSRSGLRGISHVLSTRLHQLHRRARLCRRADPLGRSRRAAVGWRRRLRHAGHDLRLLAHARRLHALQRPAGGRRRGPSIAAATASCSAKAPGCSCSSARTARAPAARRVYARSRATHSTCDAYHRVQMDPGWRRDRRAAIEARVEQAGRAPEEIGYVNYHGTSTQLNDAIESRCVRTRVRQSRGPRAGLVDQVDDRPSAGRQRRRRHRDRPRWRCRAASCRRRSISTDPDPACDMDFLPNVGRAADAGAALCNCLGFGSKNSAIVLGAVPNEERPGPDVLVVGAGPAGRDGGARAGAGRRRACA